MLESDAGAALQAAGLGCIQKGPDNVSVDPSSVFLEACRLS